MFDDLDRNIITALTADARIPYSRIAEELGVATTTVHQRAKRLADRGVITGSRIKVDWEAIGLGVTALVSVEAPADKPQSETVERLAEIPYVVNCYTVTGEFDLLLTIRARSAEHLGGLLEELRAHVPGRSRTVVVLATHFDGRMPPVDGDSP